MPLTVFLLALMAHLGADFLFQPVALLRAREEKKVQAYLLHAGNVAGLTFLFLHPLGPGPAAIFAFSAGLLHALVDWTKDRLRPKGGPVAGLYLFVADQGLHFFILLFLTGRLEFSSSAQLLSFYRSFFLPPTLAAAFTPTGPAISGNKILFIVVAYLAVVFGGSVFVREFLEAVRVAPRVEEGREVAKRMTGLYIGLLERSLILTLILAEAASAVGLVVAAKSVARFKELNEKGFAEYYLLGTLASTFLAVAGGTLAKVVLGRL